MPHYTQPGVLALCAMRDQTLIIECNGEDVPCSLFEVPNPRGVILLGHGLGVDRHDETVLRPASILNDSSFTVVVPELPFHGERSAPGSEWTELVSKWQDFWAGEGRDVLVAEWLKVLAHVRECVGLPVSYFGLSLGTQYGILFLSRTQEVSAAVLGLFGSEPPPKSRIMNLLAPRVSIPVYFIQKLDDEIHPAENTTRLYDSLGAGVKVLDATPGLHGEVSRDSIENACRFLALQTDA